MPVRALRFDDYLPTIGSAEVKGMTRLWGGGKGLTRKDDCIAFIRQGLSDPARVQAAVASLTPLEANALTLVKAAGGEMDANALCVALRVSGSVAAAPPTARGDDHSTLLLPLVRRGLFLSAGGYSPTSFGSYGAHTVFTDERLLPFAAAPIIKPFAIQPVAPPADTIKRRPQTVALDLIGALQALDNLGGIQLTADERPRVNDMRKLAKAMSWAEETFAVDGLPFPNPAVAFVHALRHAGLLTQRAAMLVLAAPVSQFATRSYVEQVRWVVSGVAQAGDWDERGRVVEYGSGSPSQLIQARQALLLGLAALPAGGVGFYAVDDLDRGLFERIGHHFSLGYLSSPPWNYGKTPEQHRQAVAAWEMEKRDNWLKRERRWLDAALMTWLYFLGLVELSPAGAAPICLRLTDLGRAVLHPEHAAPVAAPAVETRTAWVVQPNFEIVVYLDRARPEQLAFLERHAERFQAQQHVAQYRLTRESVYGALESGSTLDGLLATLEAGAGQPLAQNVVAEIREWAALREQAALHRRARLLEYPDAAARDAAARGGQAGTAIGDRFLLAPAGQTVRVRTHERVDYAQPLAKCLAAAEDGIIALAQPPRDLLLRAQLARWTEPVGRDRGGDAPSVAGPDAERWRLTQVSVKAAIASGLALTELLKLLADRLARPLPPLLEAALRAWAGERPTVGLAAVTVLQCGQSAVFQAIVTSPRLRPYLRGVLAPDLVVVDRQQVGAFQEQLRWAGLQVTSELTVQMRGYAKE